MTDQTAIPAGIDLLEEINRLRKERNAVILAHYYQDPEIQDLAESQPDKLVELRERGAEYLEISPAWGEASTREIGEMELNQLRALGYAIP